MLALALALTFQDVVDLKSGGKSEGRIVYDAAGLKVGGALVAWEDVAAFRDVADAPRAPDAGELKKRRDEFQNRLAAMSNPPAEDLFKLGQWARGVGLEAEAGSAFKRAVELDRDHAAAHAALGHVKTPDGWKTVKEVFGEKRKGIAPDDARHLLDLASWCGKNGLADEQRAILVDLLFQNGSDKSAIALARPLFASYAPSVALRPPVAGRFEAMRDRTQHHQLHVWSMYAIDFFRVDEAGLYYTGDGKKNEDFLGWDQPVVAAADGDVTAAANDFDDMAPGKPGKFEEANSVTIRHATGEVTDYGHLRKGSVRVKVGDKVRAGDEIGRIGNSGASGSPHLHFTMIIAQTPSAGRALWVGVPFAFEDFTLAGVDKKKTSIKVGRAVIQEGWTIVAPKP